MRKRPARALPRLALRLSTALHRGGGKRRRRLRLRQQCLRRRRERSGSGGQPRRERVSRDGESRSQRVALGGRKKEASAKAVADAHAATCAGGQTPQRARRADQRAQPPLRPGEHAAELAKSRRDAGRSRADNRHTRCGSKKREKRDACGAQKRGRTTRLG
jgi:hypothetical protein